MTPLRRLTAFASFAAITALLAACGSSTSTTGTDASGVTTGETVSITDAQGRTVEVPVKPEVVVATDWSVIRTLTELGVQVDAVPTSNITLPEDLSQYSGDGVTTVGTLQEPDYEAINALEPDLVIIGSRSGNPEVVTELEKFAPAVIDLSVRAETPSEQVPLTRTRVEQLGDIFGKSEQADTLMDEVEADLAATREQVVASNSTAAFVQVSGGSASAYGPGSRFGIVYDGYGYQDTGAPIDPKANHGQEVSQEFFQQYNPGAILVLDRAATIGSQGEPAALEVLDNDLVGSTDAARNDRIHVIDGFSWYIAPAAPGSLKQMSADVRESL